MTTEQQKQVQYFRLSDLTVRQLNWLIERWGTSKTEALTLLVDRAYRTETLADDLAASVSDAVVK